MRTRNRGRGWSRGAGGGAPALTGNDILTVTDNGSGLARYTTAAPHGLVGDESEQITVTGVSVGGYNVSNTVVNAAPTPTTFDLNSVVYTTDATGGTWSLS